MTTDTIICNIMYMEDKVDPSHQEIHERLLRHAERVERACSDPHAIADGFKRLMNRLANQQHSQNPSNVLDNGENSF